MGARLQHLGSWILGRLRAAHRRRVSRQAGFALLVTTVTLAILGAVVGEFGYNARVELEAANNARDQMRAEYLARSGVNLSRLLIKVQKKVLDPLRNQVGDVQISEFAPYLVKAFGGAQDEREGIGAMLGIDASAIKGLGVGKDATFDVDLSAEDGRVNVNCAGGLNPGGNSLPPTPTPGAPPTGNTSTTTVGPRVLNGPDGLYQVLVALQYPPRYNRMFENPDADGQYNKRDDVARAVIDWTDVDETRFEKPPNRGSGAEDYRYDARKDPYRAKNHFLDTVDELHLVRGVGDDWYGSFGDMLTVYGSCKVNVNAIKQEHWPIMAALIRTCAKNPQDPLVFDEPTVARVAQGALGMAKMSAMMGSLGGAQTNSITGFANLISNGPQAALSNLLGGSGQTPPPTSGSQQGAGIPVDGNCLAMIATMGPRKFYRVEASGSVSRPGGRAVQVKIRAVWDSERFNQNTVSNNPDDRQGTWAYWRME